MIKFLFFTVLIIWLAFKLAGFFVRFFMRASGFSVHRNGEPQAGATAGNPRKTAAKAKPNVTDKLGEYVDYVEVKDEK